MLLSPFFTSQGIFFQPNGSENRKFISSLDRTVSSHYADVMGLSLPKEYQDLKEAVREFSEGEMTEELLKTCNDRHEFPFQLYRKAGELGIIGAGFDETVGGSGFGLLGAAIAIEQMCRVSPGLGMAVSLGWIPGLIVDVNGNDRLRQRYVRPMVEGKAISAICMTEPNHGSDIRRVDTTVDLVAQERGAVFLVNGTKIFTTNATYATFFTILCQDGEDETSLIFDREIMENNPGELEITEMPGKMGQRMVSSCELTFKDFEIPKENVLGKRHEGLRTVINFFNKSRVEIASQGMGAAEYGLFKALSHAREREQFGRKILQHQAIGHRLAQMVTKVKQAQLLLYDTAWRYDQKRGGTWMERGLATCMVKYFIPELALDILKRAIDIFGGYGYFEEMGLEGAYRDTRITPIYEGTVEMQLDVISHILMRIDMNYLTREFF